jgi:hypothetical protein
VSKESEEDAKLAGIIYDPNNIRVSIYQGQWYEDKPQGKGKFTDFEGSVYEGNFVDGMFGGEGTLSFYQGYKYTKYVGQFSNGKKYGEGRLDFSDGSFYQGGFKDDLQHGWGVDTYVDGSTFSGNFVNGKKHGKGCYKTKFEDPSTSTTPKPKENDKNKSDNKNKSKNKTINGTSATLSAVADSKEKVEYITFDGEWANDVPTGRGITTYPDGHTETKNFKNEVFQEE